MVSQTKSPIIVIVLLCVLAFVSCEKGKTALPVVSLDPKEAPLVHTDSVIWLISDSGITRFRLNAAVCDVYAVGEKDRKWHFPEGFYLEKFDSLLVVEASVKSDTAYFYENLNLWRLIGNVKIVNEKQEKFETSELYWDQEQARVYSDSLVRVERTGSTITVIGFKSNQEMTQYRYFKIHRSTLFINHESDDHLVPDSIG